MSAEVRGGAEAVACSLDEWPEEMAAARVADGCASASSGVAVGAADVAVLAMQCSIFVVTWMLLQN